MNKAKKSLAALALAMMPAIGIACDKIEYRNKRTADAIVVNMYEGNRGNLQPMGDVSPMGDYDPRYMAFDRNDEKISQLKAENYIFNYNNPFFYKSHAVNDRLQVCIAEAVKVGGTEVPKTVMLKAEACDRDDYSLW